MTSSLKSEKRGRILVVGGTGALGSVIVADLLAQGYSVAIMHRGFTHPSMPIVIEPTKDEFIGVTEITCDVTDHDSVKAAVRNFYGQSAFTGIVYAVGHCPPRGMDREISMVLTDPDCFLKVSDDFKRQVLGLQLVCGLCEPFLASNSHIVVIGSAINRITDEQCPSWLYAGHYAAAKAGQRELVKWLRRDPAIKGKNIRVHQLDPGACDTPFHHECEHQPPSLLPVQDVADRVLKAFQSSRSLDEILVAKPPQ